MWISHQRYLGLLREQARADQRAEEYQRDCGALDGRVEALQRENRQLRERLIAAAGDARAAQSMRDVIVVELNTLRHNYAALLTKLLEPGAALNLVAPKISSQPVMQPPGVDFEDMGDARAAHEGYADTIPIEGTLDRVDDITGLVGRVYDPASELGADQPRLGDDPAIGPEM